MICLGIESTAHTFGIGIVTSDGEVLANVLDAYTTESGGMIPAKVVAHHVKVWIGLVKSALEKAGITMNDVDLISFSQGPGLGGCLRIGAIAARMLSKKYDIPILGVNHCVAHLEIAKLKTSAKDPVMLYASGANTQIIALEGGKYRVFGETLDIGIGNFLDTFARYIGIGFPGGPKIEKLAAGGKYIELPYVVKGMDTSFGGLLTNLKQKFDNGINREDLCYSLQETAFSSLIEVAERAMAHCGKTELVLGGGVACNKRLQKMCQVMCDERGAKFYNTENQFYIDNAAMIAWLGIVEFKAGHRQTLSDTCIMPYWRTDEVEVLW